MARTLKGGRCLFAWEEENWLAELFKLLKWLTFGRLNKFALRPLYHVIIAGGLEPVVSHSILYVRPASKDSFKFCPSFLSMSTVSGLTVDSKFYGIDTFLGEFL